MNDKIKSLLKRLKRLGFRGKVAVEQLDPVCGMKVSNDFFASSWQKRTYFFCSEYCQKKFESEPQNYVSRQ